MAWVGIGLLGFVVGGALVFYLLATAVGRSFPG